jgi:hypothetical protein
VDAETLAYPDESVRFDRDAAIIISAASWDWDIDPSDFANQIQPDLDETLKADPGSVDIRARIHLHQTGSAAEWSRDLVVVFEATGPVLDYISSLIEIAGVGMVLTNRLRERNRTEMAERENNVETSRLNAPPPTITLPIAIGLAASHYQSNYGPIENTEMLWNARGGLPYASVESPTGNETYTVTIRRNGDVILYTINGEGCCIEHLLITPERVICLQVPDFLNDDPWNRPRQLASGRLK